jgi:predicted helicase
VVPDEAGNWINVASTDFSTLLPIANKETKQTKRKLEERAIFKNFSLGIATNRDEWVYDLDEDTLVRKIRYFCRVYALELERWENSKKDQRINDFVDRSIKWTSELEEHLARGTKLEFKRKFVRRGIYRPFGKNWLYFADVIIHRMYQQNSFFGVGGLQKKNALICINTGNKNFNVLATDIVPSNHFNGDSQCFPLHCYKDGNEPVENITDWALDEFRRKYAPERSVKSDKATKSKKKRVAGKSARRIEKEDVFRYVYGVLHNSAYRKKYELNLKRELPRIPFYDDFWKWAAWGKKLIDLHINYERAKPYPLKRKESGEKAEKAKLRADKDVGAITIDEATTLTGVPAEAWDYRLGNRSAMEWVLDQYKESKPSDPTIAEKFDTYRFADYKEDVIELLKKVCTVSVETMKIIGAMGG